MIKKLARLLLIFLLSLLTLYLVFVSVISVSIGFANAERPGFWMPILWGVLIFCLGIFIIRLIVHVFRQMKAKEKYPYY
ncbi:MAG: hypothetical protein IMF20_01495 [Proteobacteria bacterium]|jgi:uncharacterized membrane protein (DUF485 family)|nr:hypothetical protein [Pseudomonadota bacterium]